MKKSFFKIILFTFVTVLPVFAGEAKFTRDYETAGIGFRVYETSDYLIWKLQKQFYFHSSKPHVELHERF